MNTKSATTKKETKVLKEFTIDPMIPDYSNQLFIQKKIEKVKKLIET